MVAVLGWVIGFSSLLGVGSVQVKGTRLLSAQQVRTAAGVKAGTPLIRLNTDVIRNRVEKLPEVRSVRISTSYPSTVTIAVTERVAVGYRSYGSRAQLIDADNVGFRTVRSAPAGLPNLGGQDDATSAAIATVAASLPATTARRVDSISAQSLESVTLTLTDGRTVLWGGTDRNADKARLVAALFGQPGKYFDVSDPDAVISRGGN
jgi:cell division protein FtsQ